MVSNTPMTRPLDDSTSINEVKGIFTSDILIINALRIGLKDLRDNPWQLNICFASLKDDPFTAAQYGQKEADNAKRWFLKTEIPVTIDFNPENASFPRLIVSLLESSEDKVTLGDVHYIPSQEIISEWEALTSKFNAGYDYTTGRVTLQEELPVTVSDRMVLSLGGTDYPIIEVIDNLTFRIQSSLNIILTGCVIKMAGARLVANLESATFKESYRISCIAPGDSNQLLWLHAITTYILLRYRKTLLEGRGFGESVITSKAVQKMPDGMFAVENLYGRFIDISGNVRNYWVSDVSERVGSAGFDMPGDDTGLKFSQKGFNPSSYLTNDNEDPSYAAGSGLGMSIDDMLDE
jgi:hypothetical protein